MRWLPNGQIYLIFVIPSAFMHSELEKLTVDISKKTIVVSAVKGIMPQTGLLVGEHFHDMYTIFRLKISLSSLDRVTLRKSHLERLSYLTISCADAEKAQTIADALSSDYIKTKISDDIIGTEYAVNA